MMVHVRDWSEVTAVVPTFVAVGVFDGVHRGHGALLGEMVRMARAKGMRTAVVTFYPHPKVFLRGLEGRFYLTTIEERAALLAELGIDLVMTRPFDETTRQTRATDFVKELIGKMGMCALWSGDFGLGYRREGTADFLRELAKTMPFAVHEVRDLLMLAGKRASSTRIRELLGNGQVSEANEMLGRGYRLTGEVVRGDQRGRTINFPTANLDIWEKQVLPANGVYATRVYGAGLDGHLAATNIGVRPTVDGVHQRVEAHVLDFEGDLYGRELTLEFVARVRAEQKFAGLDELKAQIAADVVQVRQLLR